MTAHWLVVSPVQVCERFSYKKITKLYTRCGWIRICDTIRKYFYYLLYICIVYVCYHKIRNTSNTPKMKQFELNPETLCSWILTSVRSNSISRLTSSSSSLLSQQYGNLALAINVHRKWMTFIIHHNQDQNHMFHT